MSNQDHLARNTLILAALLYGGAFVLFAAAVMGALGPAPVALLAMLAPWPIATVVLMAALYMMLRGRARRAARIR